VPGPWPIALTSRASRTTPIPTNRNCSEAIAGMLAAASALAVDVEGYRGQVRTKIGPVTAIEKPVWCYAYAAFRC
jgi:hypothetical protein